MNFYHAIQRSIQIEPDQVYDAFVKFSDNHVTYAGIQGTPKMLHTGRVFRSKAFSVHRICLSLNLNPNFTAYDLTETTFTFTAYNGHNNKTEASGGQIPEILFEIVEN